MIIKTFTAGPIDANNYLLIDGEEAVLIDCSEVKPEILKEIEGKKLKYILLTHGHFDHVLCCTYRRIRKYNENIWCSRGGNSACRRIYK